MKKNQHFYYDVKIEGQRQQTKSRYDSYIQDKTFEKISKKKE